jgi:hypothetical protein
VGFFTRDVGASQVHSLMQKPLWQCPRSWLIRNVLPQKQLKKTTMKWLSEKKYITQDQSLLKIFLENHQRIQHLHPLQKRKRESHMMNKMMNP